MDTLLAILMKMDIGTIVVIIGCFYLFNKHLNKKFDKIDQRFEKMDLRFEKLEERLTRIEHDLIEMKVIYRQREWWISQDEKQSKKAE